MEKTLRQPIVCVLGHVDTGKTSILDKIRGSAVALREVGTMTQHIGASFFPLETLKEICGPLSGTISEKIEITGLLIIDTPGHNIFMNLRRRGGSVADIGILVVDITKGFEAQTYESLQILKDRKTPFIVAANKIDIIPGWSKNPNSTFKDTYRNQKPTVQQRLDELLYIFIGSFSRLGINAERFDKIKDFTKTVAIIPVSAETGEGLPELLAMLIGLTQQFMHHRLTVSQGPGKGTILEVKEETGLGITLNAILFEGTLQRGDTIILGGKEMPIITKVRAILLPKPLDEIRDPRDKFTLVDSVSAASGIKISASNLEGALVGAPIVVVEENQLDSLDKIAKQVLDEVNNIRVIKDKIGVALKADTLGSLEALVSELERKGIPVRFADIGDISKREVIEASMIQKTAPMLGVILSFNVRLLPDAGEEAKKLGVPIFQSNIVYYLVEEYESWLEREKATALKKELELLILPGCIKVLPNLVFRKNKPAVFGIEVLRGRIKPRYPMLRIDGTTVGEIMQIQDRGETLSQATTGMKVAVSMKGPTVGRHFDEGDMLYVAVPEADLKKLVKYKEELSGEDLEILRDLVEIVRKRRPTWGL